jgi:hypothetical protein
MHTWLSWQWMFYTFNNNFLTFIACFHEDGCLPDLQQEYQDM